MKTISQAVTILGLSEMNAFISSIMIKQLRSRETSELLRVSLIRGKLMELLADFRSITQKGSEAFFVGIFSLLEVVLNRAMTEILQELPLNRCRQGGASGCGRRVEGYSRHSTPVRTGLLG